MSGVAGAWAAIQTALTDALGGRDGERGRVIRFVINGLVATAVHFAALVVLLEGVGVSSAGLANAVASLFGISASFVGNRHFVFRSATSTRESLPKFLLVYGAVAVVHGSGLWLWTDIAGWPYALGFVLTTATAVAVTYLGNKAFVFRTPATSTDQPAHQHTLRTVGVWQWLEQRRLRWPSKNVVAICVLIAATVLIRLPHIHEERAMLAVDGTVQVAEMERAAHGLIKTGALADPYKIPTGPTAHVAPLYPTLLAGVYGVFGFQSYAALMAQGVLSVLALATALALLPSVAHRAGLPLAAGWLAAAYLALSPLGFEYQIKGDWEAMFSAALLLTLLAGVLALYRTGWRSPRLVVGVGATTGVAALLSPGLVPAVGLAILAELWRTRRHRFARRRVFIGGVGIVAITATIMSPWVIRNAVMLDGFAPVRSNFGLELAVGNSDVAKVLTHEGWKAPGYRHPFLVETEAERVRDIGELAYMKERRDEAVAWIAADPIRFLKLTGARIAAFWVPPPAAFPGYSGLGEWARVLAFGSIGLAAWLAIVFAGIRGLGTVGILASFLAGPTLVYAVTHVDLRYRMPIEPIATLMASALAVWVLIWFWQIWRQRQGAPRLQPSGHQYTRPQMGAPKPARDEPS